MKEEMKDDHTMPGSGDLAAYMMDYSEEDASIGTLPCHHYVLGNMDFDESEFSLFADDSDKVDAVNKSEKNTVNWDAVDTLLRCCCPLCDIHVFLLVFHLMQKKNHCFYCICKTYFFILGEGCRLLPRVHELWVMNSNVFLQDKFFLCRSVKIQL
jgi:hypothetical protein